MNGTSWLLGAGYPWRSGDPAAERPGGRRSRVVANQNDGMSLATLPDGPLGLTSAEDSLGRLTLPRGVAVDGDTVLVLSTDGARIYRYDSIRVTLVPLPEIGAEGLDPDPPDAAFTEPRRFRGAANIAATGGVLYVADRAARRVQVFDLATLALLWIHTGFDDPADVAAAEQGVYIMDRGAGRVYRSAPSGESPTVVVDLPPARDEQARREQQARRQHWDRIAVDRDGRIYLRYRTPQTAQLDVFAVSARGPATQPSEQFTDTQEVRDRFAAPVVHVDGLGGVLPDQLLDPCGLRQRWDPPLRWWSAGDRLYVIDSRSRVVRVHLPDGRLRHRFGPYGADGVGVPLDAPAIWSPVDLVALEGCVLVLDERYQTVYGHAAGAEVLRKWFSAPPDFERRWRRIAHDGSGCLLLWDGVNQLVDRVDQRGQVLDQIPARAARQHFTTETAPPQPADHCAPVRLTRDGAVPRPEKESPQWPRPTFERSGVWTSQWLDSDLYNCQWHVIELSVAALPPGSRVTVRTRTSAEPQSDAEVLATIDSAGAAGSWRTTPTLAGAAQPDEAESKPRTVDVLVPSGPGQFVQLQIELDGDGIRTPIVSSLRLRFPRESLLQYLPAIYSQPEAQREFLDRFLAIMQTTWAGIEREVDTFERFLDPDSVPPEAMAYLAGWLDLRLEGTWSAEQNRRLLQAMPKLRATWGTLDGLRAWLRVYLANLGGASPEQLEQAGIPGIVESFVERRRLLLNRRDVAVLGVAEGLWSPSVERRFQVGVFDREGEVELVSPGDPELDVFHHYAHSFRVYVPAAWVRTPDDEALIRRAIEMQKPAHTTYELVLVEPRFRIGEQSTIDLDTVIGGPLPGPLVCPTVDDAPSRPAYQRLGYDTTLGGPRGHQTAGGVERTLV
jgi:phage tail-like protein